MSRQRDRFRFVRGAKIAIQKWVACMEIHLFTTVQTYVKGDRKTITFDS